MKFWSNKRISGANTKVGFKKETSEKFLLEEEDNTDHLVGGNLGV
jgi:hypothetical protein